VTTLKIEKGVPVPPVAVRVGGNEKLLQEMEIGDSVFFDKPIAARATRLYRVAKRMGLKIVLRKEPHGTRVWMMGPMDTSNAPVANTGKAPTKATGKRARRRNEPLIIEKAHGRSTGHSVRV
jgi:hypothetical protein